MDLFGRDQPEISGWEPESGGARAGKYAIRLLVLLLPFLLTATVIYNSTILHTPLDGAWDLSGIEGSFPEGEPPGRN